VTLHKYFATPPIKLKLGQQIGGGLLIANHMNQSLRWASQKESAGVRSYLIHSFLHVNTLAAPCTSHLKLCNNAEPKPYSWTKPAHFDFSASNFTVQDHILSIAGDGLRTSKFNETLVATYEKFLGQDFSQHNMSSRRWCLCSTLHTPQVLTYQHPCCLVSLILAQGNNNLKMYMRILPDLEHRWNVHKDYLVQFEKWIW
jgi:hypothetical protein